MAKMTTNSNEDRRVRRTRRHLKSALKTLLKRKPYKNIKVSELAEEADIARTTFYKHYETKDDLLFSLYDDVFKIFQEEILAEIETGEVNDYVMSTRFFQLWADQAETFTLLIDAGLDLLLLNHTKQFLEKNYAHIRKIRGIEFTSSDNDKFAPYVVDSAAGILFMMLKRWVQEGMVIPSEYLGQFFGDYSNFARPRLQL